MRYFGIFIGISCIAYILVSAVGAVTPRGTLYSNLQDGWTVQLPGKTLAEQTLPVALERYNHGASGTTATFTRPVDVPTSCSKVPCYLFLGEAGDVARISIDDLVVRNQGFSEHGLVMSRHYPLWTEIPEQSVGHHQLKVEVQTTYGIGLGLQRGPFFIGDYTAMRFHERSLTFQEVVFPLMQALVLTILGLLAFACWYLAKLDDSIMKFGIFSVAQAGFMLSFSYIPREYLPVTEASYIHYTLRLLADWSLFECLNALLPMKTGVRYGMRAAFAAYFGWFTVLCVQGAGYASFVEAVRWEFPIIVATPLIGFITAVAYEGINRALPARRYFDHNILLPALALLTLCQIWDTSLFWGFFSGPYLVKFYLVPLAVTFAFVLVKRHIRVFESLTKAKTEAEKDAVIGRLAIEFSHDLKSPLNALKTCAQIALDKKDSEYGSRVLGEVVTRTTEVSGRLQELMDYSRETIEKKRSTNLKNLGLVVHGELEPQCKERNVGLGVDFPDVQFPLDPKTFMRALVNLGKNALEASAEDQSVMINGKVIDGKLTVTVQDTGAGISTDDLPRIFEPYFTKNKNGGTGLGLSIVDRITRQHGGNIQVISNLGLGSTFILEVPQ